MDQLNPKKRPQATNECNQFIITSYAALQQRPSIECQPQIPLIIKTEEEDGNNDPSNLQGRPVSIHSVSRMSRDSEKSAVSASVNHNFQKHTVVTIKKLTRNLSASFGASPTELIAMQMWNIFLSSGIKSKRILVILFGTANLHNEKYKTLLKGCFFGELCNYDENTVRGAQTLLRERVVTSLPEDVVRQNIEQSRHIKLREQFYAYFMQFLENLKRGPLVKFRINSHASKRIVERISTSASLQPQERCRIKRKQGKQPTQ